ncbi:hypothetical protein U9M48_009391 [Paspalum notatum var. saurae]|uniref:Uncharacterized protein n=1 Tax=Paspalum notatum var. saurae TaxID=547442 RepID=A0AAQ3SR22_PASNO
MGPACQLDECPDSSAAAALPSATLEAMDAPALPAPSAPPAPAVPAAGDGGPPSSSAPEPVPRVLPSTLLLPNPPQPPSSGRARGAAVRLRGRKPAAAPYGTAGGRRPDPLVEAVRLLGRDRDVDAGVATADILELAMAKGPMFSWMSYWPEEGF